MEAHAQAVEDNLIDSLQFKLRPGASYVTNGRSVTFFPQGGNDYKPNGVRVIKINMTSDQWLDPSIVKLFSQFRILTDRLSYDRRSQQLFASSNVVAYSWLGKSAKTLTCLAALVRCFMY